MPLTRAGRRALEIAHERLRRHLDDRPHPCPCGGQDDAVLSECDRNGLPLLLRLCRSCGIVRMDPQPSPGTLAWFYADVYRDIYGPIFEPGEDPLVEKAWKGRLVDRVLRDSRIVLPSGPIVDVGCGGGWTLAAMDSSKRERIGYDFDDRLLAIGRDHGLDLRHGGIEQAVADGVKGALVVCAHVLEHVPAPVDHLVALRDVVRPNGVLYLEVPDAWRIRTDLHYDPLLYWQRAHLWDFRSGHLATLARRAGWRSVFEARLAGSIEMLLVPAEADPAAAMPRLGEEVRRELLELEASRRRPDVHVRRLLRSVRSLLSPHLRRLLGRRRR